MPECIKYFDYKKYIQLALDYKHSLQMIFLVIDSVLQCQFLSSFIKLTLIGFNFSQFKSLTVCWSPWLELSSTEGIRDVDEMFLMILFCFQCQGRGYRG